MKLHQMTLLCFPSLWTPTMVLNPQSWDFLVVDADTNPGHWNHELHVLSEFCHQEAQQILQAASSPPSPRYKWQG